jgi:hypothetical protein
MKILILGYIVRGPLGGLAWHHMQYVLGLRDLGHDVLFMEDSDDFDSCYNPETNEMSKDPNYGLRFINNLFGWFDLQDRWCYFDAHLNKWYGVDESRIKSFCNSADLLINISGVNVLRDINQKIPERIFIDTDPAFVQIRNLIHPKTRELTKAHNHFFSFGENNGKEFCTIPDDGFKWLPTRQPLFVPAWKPAQPIPSGKWTTVMQWDSYQKLTFEGTEYGMKSASFQPFEALPLLLPGERFELASGSASVPYELLKKYNWDVISSLTPTRTPQTYQEYIANSKGEWSIAKEGYVKTKSGWFSERSLSYLASGKPCILQDTGFSLFLDTGEGLFAFEKPEDVINAVNEINNNFEYHCQRARQFAIDNFDSASVLLKLLSQL